LARPTILSVFFSALAAYSLVPLKYRCRITGDIFRWGLIMAGSVTAAVPVMVLYYLAQRFVVQGLSAGAVKG
jgi:multiple sugar transport system permease protein